MRRVRMRFTIRELAILVALVALNLAAAITSWRWYWDSVAQAAQSVEQDRLRSWPPVPPVPYGPFHQIQARIPKTGEVLERVVMPVPLPNLLQIGAPVLASVSITVLVLVVPWSAGPAPRDRLAPDDAGSAGGSSPTGGSVGRRATIAVALIGLNLASAVHRPLPETVEILRGVYPWGSYYAEPSALYQPFYAVEQDGFVIHWSDGSITRPEPDDVEGHILETIVCKPDGSIVYYEGSPGLLRRLFTWPHVLRGPTGSVLEMWWPVPVAAAITFLVLRILWSRTRPRPEDDTFWFGADGESVPGGERRESARCAGFGMSEKTAG